MPLVPYTLYIWCFSCSTAIKYEFFVKKKEGNNTTTEKKISFV